MWNIFYSADAIEILMQDLLFSVSWLLFSIFWSYIVLRTLKKTSNKHPLLKPGKYIGYTFIMIGLLMTIAFTGFYFQDKYYLSNKNYKVVKGHITNIELGYKIVNFEVMGEKFRITGRKSWSNLSVLKFKKIMNKTIKVYFIPNGERDHYPSKHRILRIDVYT